MMIYLKVLINYVAVRRRGAPTDGDMVTIGNGVNSKKKRWDLAGKC